MQMVQPTFINTVQSQNGGNNMTGYRWYINVGAYGKTECTDFTFHTIEACRYDAEHNYKLSRDCYGINRVEVDDGWITVIEEVQTTVKREWIDDNGNTYFV